MGEIISYLDFGNERTISDVKAIFRFSFQFFFAKSLFIQQVICSVN